jgi:hypothetical protein
MSSGPLPSQGGTDIFRNNLGVQPDPNRSQYMPMKNQMKAYDQGRPHQDPAASNRIPMSHNFDSQIASQTSILQ